MNSLVFKIQERIDVGGYKKGFHAVALDEKLQPTLFHATDPAGVAEWAGFLINNGPLFPLHFQDISPDTVRSAEHQLKS